MIFCTSRIIIQPSALARLEKITDRWVQEQIRDRIEGPKHEPEKKGKPLLGELAGYRSIRARGQRYRIIYRVVKDKVFVSVVALGLRKEGYRDDIYELARRLLRYRLLK